MNVSTVTMSDIALAETVIRPYLQPTPLRHSPFLSQLTGADVWLKLENTQPTGSFKVRGAINKLHQHKREQPGVPVVTASAGNHGLGVAFAAQAMGGIAATVFVPTSAPLAKVSKLRHFPITLLQTGATYEDAHQAAAAYAAQTGAVEISAYDDVAVIAGQGVIGLELMLDLPHVDTILVPIGGGGMVAGIVVAFAGMFPPCQIIGVQPAASPAALLSYRDGVAYDPYEHEPTLADGLAGGFGRLPFSLTNGKVTVALATEEEIRQAIYTLAAEEQLLVEPSGAISIVPLLAHKLDLRGKRVVCVLSGGNLDISLLKSILKER